jgi:hypothetical protein
MWRVDHIDADNEMSSDGELSAAVVTHTLTCSLLGDSASKHEGGTRRPENAGRPSLRMFRPYRKLNQ